MFMNTIMLHGHVTQPCNIYTKRKQLKKIAPTGHYLPRALPSATTPTPPEQPCIIYTKRKKIKKNFKIKIHIFFAYSSSSRRHSHRPSRQSHLSQPQRK